MYVSLVQRTGSLPVYKKFSVKPIWIQGTSIISKDQALGSGEKTSPSSSSVHNAVAELHSFGQTQASLMADELIHLYTHVQRTPSMRGLPRRGIGRRRMQSLPVRLARSIPSSSHEPLNT